MDAKKTGMLIAAIRKECGKTQQDLANELHVSHATVSKWERGIGFPDITLVEPLAKCLNISIIELFNGERLDQLETGKVEKTLVDVIAVSSQAVEKNKKTMNWIIAVTIAILYIIISIITQKWELTWLIWLAYCIYRTATEWLIHKK